LIGCADILLTTAQIRKHPVATKRVRAILKATNFSLSHPAGAARRMLDGGFADRYDYALQTLKDVPSTDGWTTIPRTRSGFMLSGCVRWG